VREIDIRNVTSRKSRYVLELRGFASSPIRGVRLRDCSFGAVAQSNIVEHVEGLAMTNVKINGR
jgi:hypothetical protein